MQYSPLRRPLVLTVLAGCLTLTACQTLDPYTGEQKVNSTSKGAAIGVAAGAVIGAISGNDARQRRQRAMIGAGIGGLAGAGVGAYMDKQEDDLRKQMQGSGVSVTRKGENITLNMPGNITFKTGSAELSPSFPQVLDGVVMVLKKYEKTIIEVDGHTDNVGSSTYNQGLSERRAHTVTDYLVSKGVKSERTISIGAGEAHPIAGNDTEPGRAANRRVELTLLPLKQEG
jgi:outer membrane protein OmpA-like peptidoglycan-associated protein